MVKGRKEINFEKIIGKPYVREALLYEKLENNIVRCNVCARRCIIPPGKWGMCRLRYNKDGKLYVITYGNVSSVAPDPIEKKPLYHFWPGSNVLTFGSWSCNFICVWCQNYEISQNILLEYGNYVSPERAIELAKQYDCKGIAFSYNEPLVSMFEFSLDVMKLAKKNGLYTVYVTNGFFTEESLKALRESGLDAVNIDIKGCDPKIQKFVGAPMEPVWKSAILAKKLGIHVELTTLIVPGVNDDEECLRYIARRIARDISPETPWHVTRFHPMYRAAEYGLTTPTTVDMLEKAYKIGKEEGLYYIFIGNVPGHNLESTYCPKCGELLIERWGFDITKYNLTKEKKCPKCGTKIPIVGEYTPSRRFLFW
ncbi:MAG: AmmeMemoRadiSam system radical SAM enzyme [Candidatus Asgardarchaeia archaeon]